MSSPGIVSGAYDPVGPSACSRVAAAGSLTVGASLLAVLPALADAAPYLAILAVAAAVVALAAGSLLWSRVTIPARAVAAFAAGAVMLASLLALGVGLPGVSDASRLGGIGAFGLLTTSAAVVVLLGVDAVRRRPDQVPDRPYALGPCPPCSSSRTTKPSPCR